MKELINWRRDQQRDALKPTGIGPRVARVFASQGRSISTDVDVLSLPVFIGTPQELQSPSSGALWFMLDLDALDGSNGLA